MYNLRPNGKKQVGNRGKQRKEGEGAPLNMHCEKLLFV